MIRDVQIRPGADRRFKMSRAAFVLLTTILCGSGAIASRRTPLRRQRDGR